LTAITFANIALDLVAENVTGRMVGIRDGNYSHSEIPEPTAGARQVDTDALYNTERYRPRYDKKLGRPLLLTTL
jgi:6-phosphofructokinase 1